MTGEIHMKKISKILILIIWIVLIYILFRLNLLNGDEDHLNQFFSSYAKYKGVLFVALSSFRVAALIPSVVFMILGGIMFEPMVGFTLTLVSVFFSETIIYIVSKILIGSGLENYLINKYPKLYKLLNKSNRKILAICILCPIAPSDPACFLASTTGLSYRKFIITVIIANIPMMILYSFLGNSVISLNNNIIIIAAFILIVSCYSVYLWNKEQKQQKLI
jgi:uncharacterized membrane protein YdjX (TVP38/TMEM64 family)